MRSFLVASAVLAVAGSVSAVDHLVTVGQNGLAFTPNQITANVGDTVTFAYYPKNHTVTQSSFAAPCTPLSNATTGATGFDSGYVPVGPNTTNFPTYQVKVTVKTPLWVYCKQANHCEQGMVFAINANANKTFDAFLATAKSLATNSSSASSTAASPYATAAASSGGGGGGGDSSSATATSGADASDTSSAASPDSTDSVASSGADHVKVASMGLALVLAAFSTLLA